MNSQERAQEPSMDEILASIRRIISEEPASGRPQPQASQVAPLPANPLFKPVTPPPAEKAAASEPTFGRLADALRGPSQAPAFQAPVSAIDDDLADLLREPIAGPPAASPPPAAAPADDKSKENWAIWRSSPKPAENRVADRPAAATAKPPQFIPPTPVKAPEAKASEQPAAEPVSASAIDLGALVPRRDEPRSVPASNANGRPEPKLPSFDAAFPPKNNGSAPQPAADAKDDASSLRTQQAEPAKVSSGPVVIAAMPVVPQAQPVQAPVVAQPVETRVPEVEKKGAAAGEPGAIEASVPLPPRQIAFGQGATAEPGASPPAAEAVAADLAKTEAETSAAAASALGALAAGLAVASAQAAAVPVSQIQPEPAGSAPDAVEPSTAVAASPVPPAQAAIAAETKLQPQAAPVAPAAVQPASSPAFGPMRSLEDAVADMLRPMLQQWLTDNMPRIVEKALKIETGHVSVAPSGDKPQS